MSELTGRDAWWDRIKAFTWFRELQHDVTEYVESLRTELAALKGGLPKCSWGGCNKLGTKWIGRTFANCDEHGASYLPDVPWAEYARKQNAP